MKRQARRAYEIGIYLLVLAVIVQFLLAGLGIFQDAYFFFVHAVVDAPIIAFGALLLALVGWYAGVDRRTVWITASIFLLVVLQSLLLVPYHMGGAGALHAISGLHAVNALAIFWVALLLLDRVRHPATA
jgi:Family of unknown function (DUF6220)